MARYIFLLLFSLLATVSKAQDGFYLTQIQHEQIKKNLADYKSLIVKFDMRSQEFELLKSKFEFLQKLRSEDQIEIARLKREDITIHNLEIKVENLEGEKLKLNERILAMQVELDYKNKSLNTYKSKYLKEYSSNRGDRIISATILGMFGVCAIWGIYVSIEANYVNQ